MKRALCKSAAILLALALLLCGAPLSGLAELDLPSLDIGAFAADSGDCGENLTFSYNSGTQTLTVSGTGDMYDYTGSEVPWSELSVEHIIINEGITSVGSFAFYMQLSLKSIVIPSTVVRIGAYAFSTCPLLDTIIFAPGSSLATIDDYAFYYASSLTSLVLPSSVRSIGYNSIAFCTQLTSINLPEGMTTVGARAFYSCSGLQTIHVPSTLETVGELAFHNCPAITSITVSPGNLSFSADSNGVLFNSDKSMLIKYPTGSPNTQYTVPVSTTVIAPLAFGFSANLVTVNISENVVSIGDQAFQDCNNLISINVAPTNPYYASDSRGVLYNRSHSTLISFPPGASAQLYEIYDTVTDIAPYAFYRCGKVKSVKVPESVETIGIYSLGYYADGGEAARYSDFSIYCYMDSAAHIYAGDNSIRYQLLNEVWDGSADSVFDNGDGTANNPYVILTGDQLALMANLINGSITTYNGANVTYSDFNTAYYKLGADIYLNDTINWRNWGYQDGNGNMIAPANVWNPIGDFFGVFDGAGYTVYGAFVLNNSSTDIGLFTSLNDGDAVIKNLGVLNSFFGGGSNVGAVVGNVTAGSVINCHSRANVISTGNGAGIAGINAAEIRGCYADGIVGSDINAGGIAGENTGIISNCFSLCALEGGAAAGGIVGVNAGSGSVSTSMNLGVVGSSSGVKGGIAGSSAPQSISRCYYAAGICSGGIAGADAPESAQPLTVEQLRSSSNFVSWSFDSIWTMQGDEEFPYPELAANPFVLDIPVIYTVTVENSEHITIQPATADYFAGSTQVFTITADEGYSVNTVSVDGVVVSGGSSSYTMSNITADRKISANYYTNTYNAVFNPGEGAFPGKAVGEPLIVPVFFGELPACSDKPVLEGKDFDSWTPSLTAMTTAGASYTAVYVEHHICSYVFDHTTEPTCTAPGETVYKCSCGEEQVTVLESPGHDWGSDYTDDVPATCTMPGTQSIHCSKCTETKDSRSVAPLGHDFDMTEDGWTVDLDPTCTANGFKSRHCINDPECPARSHTYTPIQALGHRHGEESYFAVLEASCTTAGTEISLCENCGADQITRTVEPLGHQDTDWQIISPASCGATGERTCHCERCERVVTEVIPITHDFAEQFTVDRAASCIASGERSQHCTVCGERSNVTEIPALSHDYSSRTVIKAAGSYDVYTLTCSLCGCVTLGTSLPGSETEYSAAGTLRAGALPPMTYTGSPLCASPYVSSGGKQIVEGRDYITSYFNNVNAGTAYVLVSGIGSYSGDLVLPFTIKPASIASANVAALPALSANGLPQHPAPGVSLGSMPLRRDTDFVCTYSSNVEPGTASVTLRGVGNLTGTKTVNFTITANNSQFYIAPVDDMVYSGQALTPNVRVFDKNGAELEEMTDYFVSFSNNTEVGTAAVSVVGMGSYSGSTLGSSFAILPADISSLAAPSIAAAVFDGTVQEPSFRLFAPSGELVLGEDYTVDFANNLYAGRAAVSITARGNYCGSLCTSFTISRADILSVSAAVNGEAIYFTGRAHEPAVAAALAGYELMLGRDYTVVYSDNVNVGTATATLTGIGSFTGTRSVSFTIGEPPVVNVTALTLDQSSITVGYGKTAVINAVVAPANATDKQVTWRSSNTSLVSVSASSDGSSCTVKGVGKGTATITATAQDGTVIATCKVTATMTFFQRIIAFFRSLFGLSNSLMSLLG